MSDKPLKITPVQKATLVKATALQGFSCVERYAPAVKLVQQGLATYEDGRMSNGTLKATVAGRAVVMQPPSRVKYQGGEREGLWEGRVGTVFGTDPQEGIALVHWDDPDPKPICFLTHSNTPLVDLEAV